MESFGRIVLALALVALAAGMVLGQALLVAGGLVLAASALPGSTRRRAP